MEIKINKEIRSYKETVYFGLTARQLICSLLAVGTAVGLYFALRGVLDRETLGWLCIMGAAPMAAASGASTISGRPARPRKKRAVYCQTAAARY